MKKTAAALSILLFSLALLAATPPAKDSQQSVITAFYKLGMRLGPHGVPYKKDLPKFKPLLSGRLYQLLSDAAAAEELYAKKTRHEVPPLVEGDLFSSTAEGPTAFKAGACDLKDSEGTCLVSLTYTDYRDKAKIEWKDKIYLVKESAGWRIDDLEYLAQWQFGNRGRLQQILRDVIKEANEFPDQP
jgi:hypothetical protein